MAADTITSGTFKGLTSQQLNAYYHSLPGPTDAQLASNTTEGHGKADGMNDQSKPIYNPSPQQEQFLTQIAQSHWSQGSTFDKFMSTVLPLATAAGLGGAFGPAIAGAVGATSGGVAAGAITGATTGASGAALTGQSVGKGALVGAVGGGLGAAASGGSASGAVNNATGIGTTASNALVKGAVGAGVGALGAKVGGGNVGAGAISGGVGGAVGSLATSGSGSLGASPGVAGAIGSIAGKVAGSTAGAAAGGNNISQGISHGVNAIGAAGAIAGGTSMANGSPGTSNVGQGLGLGNSLLSTVGGVVGAVGGIQQGNANGNVLSNAQAGSGIGTNTSITGPNGTSTINNGKTTVGLSPGLGLANTQLGTFAGQQAGLAQTAGQQTGTSQAFANKQATTGSALPTSTNGALANNSVRQTGVLGNETGLMAAGNNVINNGGASDFASAAKDQLGNLNTDFNSVYNNSLSALNDALKDPTAQAESQMADAQFGRGQLGTSGGALQTQAFAKGLGQAYLGNQQTAFNEATNTRNSDVSNAGALSGAGNNILNTGNSLLANAYGQFNNTSQLNNTTANSMFGQSQAISQLGNQYAQENFNNATTMAKLPGQLADQYATNANLGIQGATGINNIGLNNTKLALDVGTQQGNQYNGAMGNAAKVVASGQPTNGLTSIGGALSTIGNSNLLGGIGSAFKSAVGGTANNGSASNPIMAGYDASGNIDYSDPSAGDYSQFAPDNNNFSMDFGP